MGKLVPRNFNLGKKTRVNLIPFLWNCVIWKVFHKNKQVTKYALKKPPNLLALARYKCYNINDRVYKKKRVKIYNIPTIELMKINCIFFLFRFTLHYEICTFKRKCVFLLNIRVRKFVVVRDYKLCHDILNTWIQNCVCDVTSGV